MDMRDQIKINELSVKLTDKTITPKEIAELENLLNNNSEAIEYFVDCLIDIRQLHELLAIKIEGSHDSYTIEEEYCSKEVFDFNLWDQWLHYEKTAPGIAIEKPAPITEDEDENKNKNKTQIKPSKRTVNKFSLYTAIFSAAAFVTLYVFVQFFMPLQVATIVKSDDLKWSKNSIPTSSGALLSTGTYAIEKGNLEIQLFQGANVSLTAPAVFKLVSENGMFLNKGRLFANVPGQAVGFAVDTVSGKVTDLGTKFGVYIGDDINKAEVAVIKGKVKVNKQMNGSSIEETLKQGDACRVRKGSSNIESVAFASSEFVSEAVTLYKHAIKNSGPVAYWNFNDIDSNSIATIYGNAVYHGQIKGGVTPEALGIENTKKENLKALNFDGHTDSSVHLSNDNIFNPDDKSFTVSVWFKVEPSENAFGGSYIISKNSGRRDVPNYKRFWGWGIFVNGDDLFIQTYSGSKDDSYGVWLNNFDCLDSQWHNVVMVIDRGSNQLLGYLDGSTDGWKVTLPKDEQLYKDNEIYVSDLVNGCRDKYAMGDKIYNNDLLRISGRSDRINNLTTKYCAPFKGLVYDTAIWRRALSPDEIQALFKSNPLSDKSLVE